MLGGIGSMSAHVAEGPVVLIVPTRESGEIYLVSVAEATVPCPKLVVGMRIHREIHAMPTQAWAWHPANRARFTKHGTKKQVSPNFGNRRYNEISLRKVEGARRSETIVAPNQ
jgi:hypothetical protein